MVIEIAGIGATSPSLRTSKSHIKGRGINLWNKSVTNCLVGVRTSKRIRNLNMWWRVNNIGSRSLTPSQIKLWYIHLSELCLLQKLENNGLPPFLSPTLPPAFGLDQATIIPSPLSPTLPGEFQPAAKTSEYPIFLIQKLTLEDQRQAQIQRQMAKSGNAKTYLRIKISLMIHLHPRRQGNLPLLL
jgi:hypothetical protein